MHLSRLLVPICVLSLLAACGLRRTREPVVARVGDVVLTAAELAEQLPEGGGEAGLARERVVENWVREELLYQEALARRLDEDLHLRQLLAQARRDLLVAALLDREFDGREVEVGEAALRTYYEQHQDEFRRTRPAIRARHILLASQRDANAQRRRLEGGASFEEVAQSHSLDESSRMRGGDLGFFTEEDDSILWKVCSGLPLNRLSKPQKTARGYHIIQVLERREAGSLRALDEVRSQLVETLVRQTHRQRLDEFVERLKTAHKWQIYDEQLTAMP